MNSQIVFVFGLSVLAFLVSTVCGFIVDNKISHILMVSGIALLVFAALGFGIHAFLQQRVPEFIQFLENFGAAGMGEEDEDYAGAGGGLDTGPSEEGATSSASLDAENTDSFGRATPSKKQNGQFGDHIMVDNIAIKNEPKLMAEAIRTMLQKDEDGG